jgi:hypothetical protein
MIPTRRVPRAGLIRAPEKGIHDRSPPPCSRRPPLACPANQQSCAHKPG